MAENTRWHKKIFAMLLEQEKGVRSWRQFAADVDLPDGDHTLTVRAVDARGNVQDEAERPVVPDGATGLHTIRVSVG